ncbi:hypothetical protein C8T65DRAFT_9491 [Cerioporus squamosus]|nr:hypothetical protein C8T65DRAFT_9491 [Cerioporus squamosus]
MHASQHPQPPEADDAAPAGHDIVAALTTQGIRVRDFAYENTLPPVTTVPRFSVQVQPKRRMLKRTRDMHDGHDDGEESDEEDPRIPRTWYIDSDGHGVSHAYRYRKKTATLERTLTEPADEEPPSQGINTRAPVFAQPSHRYRLPPASPRPCQEGAQGPTTPQRLIRQSQSRSPNRFLSPIDTVPHSQPSAQGESQETESWIDTPLVTPNGSLQWPVQNTSALPASQLESMLPQLDDAEQNFTLSQLGFSPERSQATSAPSPAGTPSRARHVIPQIPPPAEFNTRARPSAGPSRSRPASRSPVRPTTCSGAPLPALQPAPAPRYDFRKRPVVVNAPAPPRGASRARTSGHAASRASEKTAPPSKKRKITPPKSSTASNGTTTATGRGRKKTADVKENR